MLVVNLFGGPGAGKSTGAAHIFSALKMLEVNAELVPEFAKDKVWEGDEEVFKNQAYIFGKQSFRMSRLRDKVDVIVTDAPLFHSAYYNNDPLLGDEFNQVVRRVFDSYNNLNIFVERVKKYNPSGRFQSEERADKTAQSLEKFLYDNHVPFYPIHGQLDSYKYVVELTMKKLRGEI